MAGRLWRPHTHICKRCSRSWPCNCHPSEALYLRLCDSCGAYEHMTQTEQELCPECEQPCEGRLPGGSRYCLPCSYEDDDRAADSDPYDREPPSF